MSLDALTIYESPFPKKRIGKDNDGGYVIVDIPCIISMFSISSGYDAFISGGISNDISFEDALLDYYIDIQSCFAFDGTINNIPSARNETKIKFIKKNLGYTNNQNISNLEEYIKPYSNIFMKIDIEGHEYGLFNSIIENGLMHNIRQLVLELHTPADIRKHPTYYTNLSTFGSSDNILLDLLTKLNKTHTILHLHGNNGCATHIQSRKIIPNVFEITLVRNDILEDIGYTWPSNTNIIPSSIDMPNIPNKQDIILNYPPFVKV